MPPADFTLLAQFPPPLALQAQDPPAGGPGPEGPAGDSTGAPAGGESTVAPGTANPAGPQGAPGAPPPQWYSVLSSPIVPLILLVLVFYVFVLGGSRKRDKQRQQLISSLSRGDRVTTIGGIIGNVVDASGEEVVLKIDENNNTKMRITRAAVASVVKAGGSDGAK